MTPIPEIISDIVAAVRVELATDAPYYEYGRMPYIANQIDLKTKDISNAGKIFPLIALLGDIKETNKEGSRTATITVIFFAETKHDYSNPQRYSTTFPNLYSLLDLFVKHMGNDSRLVGSYPEYTQLDSAYYKGQFNALSSFTDVIACEFDIEVLESVCDYVEPTTFDLVLTSETGGTTVPVPGTYTENNGAYKSFFADAGEGYIFNQWLLNGQPETDNPILVRYLSNNTLTAQFTSIGLLTDRLKVFESAPKNRGNWYNGDHSTYDNDVMVKNIKGGKFVTSVTVVTGLQLVGGTLIDFNIKFIPTTFIAGRVIFRSASSSPGMRGIYLYYTANLATLILLIGNGTNLQSLTATKSTVNVPIVHEISIYWSGKNGDLITLAWNGAINTVTAIATHEWTGNSSLPIIIGETTSTIPALIFNTKLTGKFEYILNHGQGSTVYDISGNNNHGTVTGATLSTFWGSTSDVVEPYEHTLGCTLYKKDSDNTIMPICMNTNAVISGFTRIGYFPPTSGALKGLPLKPKNAPLYWFVTLMLMLS